MVYIVATPIGNLEDISYRAIEVLKLVDCIYCEDTRHSLKLLNAYEIKKPLFSCHKFNEKEASKKIIQLAREGKNVALVSDAGTPVVSDPGNILCKELYENGIEFTIIPGACACISALVLSALPADKFAFIGFLRGKNTEKKDFLKPYINLDMTMIFYSAPQDVDDDIKLLYEVFGDRECVAVREITKIHEEAKHFNLKNGLDGEKRGEYVLVVSGGERKECSLNSLSEIEHINYYIAQGLDKKEALKQTAKDRGVSKSDLYKFTIKDNDKKG